MTIEHTQSEIIIRLPANTNLEGVERLLHFLRYQERTAKSTATQTQVDALAKEVNQSWWKRNQERLLSEK